MKKIELNDLVNLVNQKEFKKFGEYIISPYFNIPGRLINLYRYLEKNYDKVKSGRINREDSAKKLLGDKYSGTALRKLYSDFTKEIYNYMAITEFLNDINYKQLLLLKQLKSRNKQNIYKTKLKETKKNYERIIDNDTRSKLMAEIYWEEYSSEPQSVFHRYSHSLQKSSDLLDEYYISRKLLHFQLMFSKQFLNKEPIGYKWNMSEGILAFIENNTSYIKENLPEIYLKYTMLKMLDFKHDAYIDEFRDYIESNIEKLPEQKVRDYYSDLYNYLSMRIGRGEHKFRTTLLGLLKSIDRKNLLLDENGENISYYSFKLISDTCIFEKDLDWLEYFINKYKIKLSVHNKKNIVNLVYAKLYYYRNDFREARINLAKVDYRDYIHYLDAKLLQSCIEFDSQNYIEIYYIFDSVRKYLRKNRNIPTHFSVGHNRFIYYLDKMVKICEGNFKERSYEIKNLSNELISEKQPVYARKWLEEKIMNLN